MRKLMILMFVFLFAGCAILGIKPPPSVCDGIASGESLLCDTARKNDLHLETVGNIIMLVNLSAIEDGSYKASEALSVLRSVKIAAAAGPSGAALVNIVTAALAGKPSLTAAGIMVLSPYLSYMNTVSPIKAKDQELLNFWLDQQINLLNAPR